MKSDLVPQTVENQASFLQSSHACKHAEVISAITSQAVHVTLVSLWHVFKQNLSTIGSSLGSRQPSVENNLHPLECSLA